MRMNEKSFSINTTLAIKWSQFVMAVRWIHYDVYVCVRVCAYMFCVHVCECVCLCVHVCVCMCVCLCVHVCACMCVCLSSRVRMLKCSWRFYLFRLLTRPSSSSAIAYGNRATIWTVAATPSMSCHVIVVIETIIIIVLVHYIVVTIISSSYWRLFTLTIIFL